MNRHQSVQVPLALPVDEAALLAKVEVLFVRSPSIRRRYGTPAAALADPVAGKCLRLCARQLLLAERFKNTGPRT